MELLDALRWRYSVNKFDTEAKIPEEKINQICMSLTLSPMHVGIQPYKFFVIKNAEVLKQLYHASEYDLSVTTCSHLIVFCNKKNINLEKDLDLYFDELAHFQGITIDKLNRYKNELLKYYNDTYIKNNPYWAILQMYIAIGIGVASIASLGLDSNIIEHFSKEEVDSVLQIKQEEYGSYVLMPIGYRNIDDPYQNMDKFRHRSEFLFEKIY